uniref:Uncharacterized protein n=1 Tax=Anguilla anguilla TaxID=7936 RepID=A0A0E9RL81_ANGAN
MPMNFIVIYFSNVFSSLPKYVYIHIYI